MSDFKELAEKKLAVYAKQSTVSELVVTESSATFYSKDSSGAVRKHEFTANGASIVIADSFPAEKAKKQEVVAPVEEPVAAPKEESALAKTFKKLKGK